MTDVTTPSRPRQIPNGGRYTVSPPNNLTIPQSTIPVHSHSGSHSHSHLAMSPVTQSGSYEFDRIIKAGQVLKRTRKTKSWKPIYIVLRPNILSIYRKEESPLRHQINLSELTAVARQKDPKRKDRYVFGLFSPSRNYHLEASSEQQAQEWVELIRREARMDQAEEEMYLASPGGEHSAYHGFERSIDANLGAIHSNDERGGYSSSDIEALNSLPKHRNPTYAIARRTSHMDFTGTDRASLSDFSDAGPAARMSALSLAPTSVDGGGRPSTSSIPPPTTANFSTIYGPTPIHPARPSLGARNPSQLSTTGAGMTSESTSVRQPLPASDDARVVYQSWLYLLKYKSGMRQWKKIWMVLRPRALTLYKNEEEYSAKLVLPMSSMIDVVEIDAISRGRTSCMQVICEERNYRFCCWDEEGLARWLGAFKSLLARRRASREGGVVVS